MAEIKKSLKYFMRAQQPEVITVPGVDTFRDEEGNIVPLQIRVLTQEEINKINNNYRHRSIATDKKGNPLIANGEVVWKTEFDGARASRHMMVEALQYPDLKDKELMDYYKCVDVTEMPLKVFSTPSEYSQVSQIIMKALGLASEVSDEEDLEAAKKLIRDKGSDGYWASVLWQRHNLRPEEFFNMPRKTQIFYIASEILEEKDPVRMDTTRIKS